MAGPGGPSGSIQYNNSGSFGGFGNWSGTIATLPALTVTNNALVSGTLTVTGHVTLEGVTSTGATGTGLLVFGNTPTLIAPILGTPISGTLTNCTLPVGGITGLGTGVATFLATPSSANLAAAVTDETGSGALVFGTSPTLTTPVLGVASYTSLAGGAIVQTVSSANALAVGPSGTTNPTLNVVTNTASGITGLSITNAASGAGVTLTALGGTNENIFINPKGSGYLKTGASLFGIGTTPTYGLHLAPISGLTAGQTAFVQDATASIGQTKIVVQEGAVAGGDDATVKRILEFRKADGTATWGFASRSSDSAAIKFGTGEGTTAQKFWNDGSIYLLNNSAVLAFGGGADTGLGRSAAGRLEINNGTIGTFRDLEVRQVFAAGDNAGLASTTSLTNATDATTTNAYTVKGGQVATTANTGWIKIYVGTTVAWVPYWANATP